MADLLPDESDLTLPRSDRRELVRWAVTCATRLLLIFEQDRPNDRRLADALAGALAGALVFSRGELSIGAARKLAFDCHATARDAEAPAAVAVARACGQAVATAHMAGHSRQVPAYTSKALAADSARCDAELYPAHVLWSTCWQTSRSSEFRDAPELRVGLA